MKKDGNGIYNYYCTSIVSPNHAATIVGWDDNYSKENFKDKPVHDGAYIVMNTYGTVWGNGGYYYVSYDDANIENMTTSITNVGKKDYDNIYQYDELYRSNVISASSVKSAYMANVFTRQDNSVKEKLDSVSVALDRTCNVELYVNTDVETDINERDFNNLRKVEIEDGSNLSSGYHRIKLKDEVELTSDKFIVCVKTTATNSEGIGISLEDKISSTEWYKNVDANANEGFISFDGKNWGDITEITIESKQLSNASLCVKAFTINNGKNTQINVGDTYKIDKSKKYIYNVSANTKTSDFEKVLNETGNNGYKVSNTINSTIKTGSKVEFADGTTYTIIVIGDINQDGSMDVIDLAKMKKYILSLTTLNDECKYASDLNVDGNVDIIDLARMKKELIK